MNRLRTTVWVLILSAVTCAECFAHKPSDSYLRIVGGGDQLSIEWDIAIKDLEFLVGLDADQNGQITWGEVRRQRQAIVAHALSRLRIVADGRECGLDARDMLITRHSDGSYVVLTLDSGAPGSFESLEIHYNLLFDVDPTHRGLVLFQNSEASSTHVLSPNSRSATIRSGELNLWRSLADYAQEGVWHIWIGFDHILFLVSLLLPSVLTLRDRTWQPIEDFRPACLSVLKVVTMFTLAHSITLWLAVMEYVTLPSQLVEATIALSIVVTALNNLRPTLPLSNWVIAFGFGLVHGFGFANVLIDLGLSKMTLALSLLGFNVGVELGQLAIVLMFLPIAYLLRVTWFYRQPVFQFGSMLIAVVAGLWMYERLFNAEILGF